MKPGMLKTNISTAGSAPVAGGDARARLLKRFGRWGFAFFAVKGVLWLVGPALLAWFSLE